MENFLKDFVEDRVAGLLHEIRRKSISFAMTTRVITLFITLVVMLVGCSSNNNGNIVAIDKKLLREKVMVFQGAKSTILVLSAKDFFVGNTANFKCSTSRTLDLVFKLSGYYQAPSISVTGYSKDSSVPRVGKALAAERAGRIAHYLWRFGVPSNFVYADGKDKIFANGSERAVQNDVVLIDIREAGK